MKKLILKSQRGFTIIEVMIVLAIAGLIMALVFIAVPQLQRNTRDNQRQNMAARLKTEIESFSGNNQGVYPFKSATGAYQNCTAVTGTQTCNDWLSRYITGSTPPVAITDPSTGANEVINIADAAANSVPTVTWAQGNLWITVGARCGGELPTSTGTAGSATSKTYSINIALDRSNTFYCVDNG